MTEPTSPAPDFTSPIAGRIEVRVPCSWCVDRQMIPRHQFDEHVARLHPDVQSVEMRAVTSPAPADPALRDRMAAAARTVPLRLGPNAVAMAQRGEPVILNLNEADALADAVLAVLPDSDHRLALSEALDLGTGAPWDAIRERAAEVVAEARHAPADRAAAPDVVTAIVAALEERAAELSALAEEEMRPSIEERAQEWYQAAAVAKRAATRRLADEAQQGEAHPPEHRWAAELYDPLAEEWIPGRFHKSRGGAVAQLNHAREIGLTWKDGTPADRRLMRETTTYTVEAEGAQR